MPDLTFSMDADEEKLILYEREEVITLSIGFCYGLWYLMFLELTEFFVVCRLLTMS
jgi:hypothetical protein